MANFKKTGKRKISYRNKSPDVRNYVRFQRHKAKELLNADIDDDDVELAVKNAKRKVNKYSV